LQTPNAGLGVTITSSGVMVGAHGSAQAVAIGDLNNDKNLDGVVIVTDMNLTGPSSTRVLVALGDGQRHFTSPAEVAGTDGVTSVTLADVNTDGNPDLQVYLNFATTPTTFYGDGAGHFSTTPPQ
jgi:FG-GAP-like repeat